MANAPHIVILTPGFADGEEDTACIPPLQVYLKHLQLMQPALRISVIAFQYPYQQGEYTWHGLTVYSSGGGNRKFPARLLSWNRAMRKFKQLHQQWPVTMIHSFWLSECAYIGTRLAKQFRLPHCVTLMGQDVKPSNKYLKKVSLSDLTTVAVSEYQKELFEATTGSAANHLIPWGMEPFDVASEARTIDVLGVGSLIQLKQFDRWVAMVAALKERHPLRACLIGDGPQAAALQSKAAALGVEDCIEFTGQLPRDEVLQYMAKSKVLLHPSEYESFGFVFAEALQSGMYVVSHPVGAAQPSEKWKVAATEEGLLEALEAVLPQQHYEPISLYPIASTVAAYLTIYDC